MGSFLTSKVVFKIILGALFEFKSKGKYERKVLNGLKRNFKKKQICKCMFIYVFKRKMCVNSFCLLLQVWFFFGAGRSTDGKRMKQNVTLQNFANTMM